jgi:Xaa-Pro aminopeptidase
MEKKQFIELFKSSPSIKAEGIWEAQQIAKRCMEALCSYLRPGLSRGQIHEYCAKVMELDGSEGWWIHNDPALILYGPHTAFSSHDDPAPLFERLRVADDDYITVDVAPTVSGGWGDLTRCFVMENGAVIPWQESKNEEILRGMALEEELHRAFVEFVDEKTTFSELHAFTQAFLEKRGYRNCDYHGNFGHTVENDRKDRVTIVSGEDRSIVSWGRPITFEPHICRLGGNIGIKHENMYVFCDGKMTEV